MAKLGGPHRIALSSGDTSKYTAHKNTYYRTNLKSLGNTARLSELSKNREVGRKCKREMSVEVTPQGDPFAVLQTI